MRSVVRLGALAAVCTFLTCIDAEAQQFSRAMREVFRGDQFKGYQWLDYPVDDFGVGTAYRGSRDRIDPKDFLCATFTCLGIKRPATEDDWLSLRATPDTAYADVGCGGALDLALNSKSGLTLAAFIPQIFRVIGLSGNLQRDTEKSSKVTAVTGCSRMLIPGRTRAHIRGLKQDTTGIKSALDSGQLVLVVGDVVVRSLTVDVKATSNTKAALEAKLAGEAKKTFGDATPLKVEISRSGEGNYHLKVPSPVIVGVLAVRQPSGALGAGPAADDWTRWTPTTIPMPPKR